MKRILISILIIFLTIYLFAGDKQHIISLEKVNIPVRNVGFQLIEVTNVTGKISEIGFIEKGIGYADVPAHFPKDITEEINTFIIHNLNEPKGGNEQLYLRVNSLMISESYNGMNETAVVKLELTFIYKTGSQYFEKLTVSKTTSESSSIGISKRQPFLIGQAIADCFDMFYERSKERKLTNIEITHEDLFIKPVEDKKLLEEFLSADRSTKGLYKTYLDFKENTPDTETGFEVDYKIKSSGDESVSIKYARITNSDSGEKIDTVWGFTDGEVIYTSVGKKYLPLQKDKQGYYLELKVVDQGTMGLAGIAGGLIGSSIAYAATPKSKVRLRYKSGQFDYSDQGGAIDTKTQPDFCVVFFSSAYNKPDSKLELYVNDNLCCTLNKETWYQWALNGPDETIKVTVKSSNGLSMSKEISTSTDNKDVYLLIDKKKKEPQINKVLKNNLSGIQSLMNPENRVYGNEGSVEKESSQL